MNEHSIDSPPVQIRKLDRDRLEVAYGVASQRLLPWPILNAPFEGAWCVLAPGDSSTAHAHHEHELFVAMTGRAELEVDGQRHRFDAGDLALLRPGSTHHVHNDGDSDFQWYAIWWDDESAHGYLGAAAAKTAVPQPEAVNS
ncbi:cupin domain-containing protein [Nocardia sp. NPDC101769]|uniref:cupin domain-containing protein n=1 Tax=Nocardia sp. NPDC101769 TaxID=3364333 RepID=UPI00381A7D10